MSERPEEPQRPVEPEPGPTASWSESERPVDGPGYAQPYGQPAPGPDGQPGYPPTGYPPGPGPYGQPAPGSSGPPGPNPAPSSPVRYGQPGPGPAPYGSPPAGYPGGSAYGVAPLSYSDERLWGTLTHISVPFFGFIGPLVVYLAFKDRSARLKDNAVEALNFSILYTIALTVSVFLTFVVIGIVVMPLVIIAALVLNILGAVAANRGEVYRYPVNWRVVK